MKKIYIALGLAAMSFGACKPDLRSEAPTANGLDFTNYLAIGNSLTAGYADGSLYRSGQENSYPAILASQFGLFGNYTFKQPLLPGEAGWPNLRRVLGHYTSPCTGTTSASPISYMGTIDTAGSSMNISAEGPFNNMGIPGIRAVDYLAPNYAVISAMFGAPYAMRIFKSPTSRPIDEIRNFPATFFTLWLGSNDVLGYALSGGEGNPLPTHPNNISDVNAFRAAYDSVVKVMTQNGAKGVLINIPDVTSIPHFTTVPINGLQLDATQAAGLNAAYAGTGITFGAGANNFVIEDPNSPLGFRQAETGELVLITIPQDSIRCGGWGSTKPIPTRFILTETEIQNVRAATEAFNSFIESEAILYHLAHVDMNAYLRTLASGIKFNGVDYSPAFVSGGAFSLDGVHLTQRGYAIVANEIIRSINAFYGSTIPAADVNKYEGVRFP